MSIALVAIQYFILGLWPILVYANYPIHNLQIFLAALFGSAILCLSLYFGKAMLRMVYREFSLKEKILLGVVSFVQIFQLALVFPGIISVDNLRMLDILMDGSWSAWGSSSYSLSLLASHFIFLSPFRISILNLFILIFDLVCFLRLLPRKQPAWILALIMIFFCAPQTSLLILFENRDSLNSLLLVWLSLGLVAQWTPYRKDPWFHIYTLTLLTLFLIDLRQEAKILILLFPIGICWQKNMPTKRVLQLTAVIIFTSLSIILLQKYFFDLDSYPAEYKATPLINPLSYVFHERGLSAASEGELQDLERFFKVQYLIDYYNPFEIWPFHKGGVRYPFTEEDFKAFRHAALSIIARYPSLFLQNRLNLSKHMLMFEGSQFETFDFLKLEIKLPHRKPLLWRQFVVDYGPSFAPGLKKSMLKSFESIRSPSSSFARYFFASCFVPLVLMVTLIASYRILPQLFAAALINIIRLLIVILLAPAAYFKYIASFWLLGWLFLIYILALKFEDVGKCSPQKLAP